MWLNPRSNDKISLLKYAYILYVVTYNVDQGNINDIPENTILVHRKKDCLYRY